MPYQRKDSPVWWVSYIDSSGRRIRRSTGTTERKEAEALEHAWRLDAYQRATWGTAPERTFDELMLAYLPAHDRPRDRYSAKALLPHFTGRSLSSLGAQDITSYKDARSKACSNSSIVCRFSPIASGMPVCRAISA